jgi:hypothetical protein
MDDVYADIEFITGEPGVMTHMLPSALDALIPYLKSVATDERFWDGQYDASHLGEINVPEMDEEQKREFWRLFSN